MGNETLSSLPPPNATNPINPGPDPAIVDMAQTCYTILASNMSSTPEAVMGVVHTYYQFPYITVISLNAVFGLLFAFSDVLQPLYDRKMPDYVDIAGYTVDTELDIVSDFGLFVFNMNIAAIVMVEGLAYVI